MITTIFSNRGRRVITKTGGGSQIVVNSLLPVHYEPVGLVFFLKDFSREDGSQKPPLQMLEFRTLNKVQ